MPMLRVSAVMVLMALATASPPQSLQRKTVKNLHQASQSGKNAFLQMRHVQRTHHTPGKAQTFHALPNMPKMFEAKNMCIKADDSCMSASREAMDDNSLVKRLNMRPVPDDYEGELLPRALLLTSPVEKAGNKMVHKWGEAIFPVFDHIHQLKGQHFIENSTASKELAAPFTSVLFPQVFSLKSFGDERSSWYLKVVDAVAAENGYPGNVQKLFCQDLSQNEMCFSSILHYGHNPEKTGKKEQYFSKPASAEKLREQMFELTGNKGEFKPKRHALIMKQVDSSGWLNHLEVELKLKEALEKRCWKVKTWELPGDYERSVEKQVNLFKHTSLIIGNHVPQNEHMVWMNDKGGVIEDKNCLCSDYGFGKLAHQSGLNYKQTYGAGKPLLGDACDSAILNSCAQGVPRFVNFETEILPTVHEMLNELEEKNDFGECPGLRPAKEEQQ